MSDKSPLLEYAPRVRRRRRIWIVALIIFAVGLAVVAYFLFAGFELARTG